MTVALVASSTSGTTDAQGSSRTVPVPAGAASGHVAVIDLEIWLDTSTDPTISWPSGFTQIGYVESTTDGFTRLYRALKVLTGADSGNYSMSWSGSYWNQAQATLWSGVDGTTPQDVATASAVTAANTSHAAPSLTTSNAGCGMLFGEANENSSTSLPPTGYTEQQEANYLKTNTKIAGSAGSETISGGSQSTSTVKVGLLTALRPAGGGGTAITPATETDTAQTPTRLRLSTVAAATETDQAQTPTRSRQVAVPPAAETDVALTPARSRTTVVPPALETDIALPPTQPGGIPITPATETDTALTPARQRLIAVAFATETDQALSPARTRLVDVPAAGETDTAQTPARTRTTLVSAALETDEAIAPHNPNEVVRDLDLVAVIEPPRFRTTIEPARFRTEIDT